MYKLTKEEIESLPDFMPVVGYEGLYEVGKDGSVWSLNYNHTGQRKRLSATPFDKWGHLHVSLCKDGKQKDYRVHQLVLNAYLSKPAEDLEVLHQNSKPADNRLENLAWGTHQENMDDPHRKMLMSEIMTNRKDQSVPVLCIETGVIYPSVSEASRQMGINKSHLAACCRGELKSAGGYHWQKVSA